MHFRLRLLLLVALVAGAAAALSGAAAAQPAAARSDDLTIIIRPVKPAPATAPPTAPPVMAEPAPVLSPKPDVSEEWVVTQSGRFQALPEDAPQAAVDAAVAEELETAAPEAAAVDGALARHAVDAIFPVAESAGAGVDAATAAPANRPPTPSASVKLQAAGVQARQSAEKASKGTRPKAKRPAKRSGAARTAGRASEKPQRATAKKPTRAKGTAAGAKQRRHTRAPKASVRRHAQKTSVRRQAQIRKATARVKRALRATAARRRARIPAPRIIDVPVRKVRGIVVHRRIAGRTAALLAAADRANLRLNGWGYRSTRRQIQLRRQHCGKSRYAMYRMPSGRCWPPTAPPGKSMHERGLAIDFYVEGRKGRALPIAGTREFRWLKRNGARYGFYNLPSEAWHWSVNGR